MITQGIDHIAQNPDLALGPSGLAAVTSMGSGRVAPTITALLGLAAAVLAARAFAQARRPADPSATDGGGHRPTGLLLGLLAVILGLVHLAAADGGPGTGNGVVASAAAIALGSVAVALDLFSGRRRGSPTGAGALAGAPRHARGTSDPAPRG